MTPLFDGLGDHAKDCVKANGRWFHTLRRVESVQVFLACRPISVVVAILAPSMLVLSLWHPVSVV